MRTIIRGRENIAAVVLAILGVAIIYYGERLTSSYYQSVAANLGTGVIALAAGIALVNVYFDYHARRRAVRPLLKLVTPSIQKHHNDLLQEAWNVFGKPQFGELLSRYASNNGDPLALAPDERRKLYDMVKPKKKTHDDLLLKLDAELKELSFILGWSFDASILESSFSCRFAITKFLTTTCDDTDQSVKDICEQFLDIAFMSHQVFDGLVTIIGMPKDEIYSD